MNATVADAGKTTEFLTNYGEKVRLYLDLQGEEQWLEVDDNGLGAREQVQEALQRIRLLDMRVEWEEPELTDKGVRFCVSRAW